MLSMLARIFFKYFLNALLLVFTFHLSDEIAKSVIKILGFSSFAVKLSKVQLQYNQSVGKH